MSKGKALIIIHDLYQEDNVFQLGPAYIAACLKKAGHDVETYCMDIFHYTNQDLAKYLDEREFDLIAMGFLAARFNETVIDVCKVINEHKKGAWLQLGGHGPSPIPEYVLKITDADIIGIGECEDTIVELMECKLANGDISRVDGIAYKSNGNVFINKKRRPIKNLDSIPFPAWELFPMTEYTNSIKTSVMKPSDKLLTIISSRGCTNRCNFCYRMEDGIRVRSIDNVVEEIKILNDKYGVTYFNTQDELFVLSKQRIKNFAKSLKQNGLNIKYDANCRVDIFDEELAEILKESGCVFLNIGFESTSQKILDKMNKNTTVEENVRAAEIANKVGIGIGLNCIWGEPGDDEQTLRDNAAFITQFNTYDQIRTIRPVTAYPGCDLYYEAIEKGLLKGPEDFFNRFKNSDLITVNFMDMPLERAYELLYDVNKSLIIDHFEHTSKDMNAANELIENFRLLYTGKQEKFRGARKYTEDDQRHIKK